MTQSQQEMVAKLKGELLKGGIIFAQRGVGKTMAIIEILKDDPYAIVIVRSHTHLLSFLRAAGPLVKEVEGRIFTFDSTESSVLYGKLDNKRLYGDELTLSQIERLAETRRQFHASTTTAILPIRVVDNET